MDSTDGAATPGRIQAIADLVRRAVIFAGFLLAMSLGYAVFSTAAHASGGIEPPLPAALPTAPIPAALPTALPVAIPI